MYIYTYILRTSSAFYHSCRFFSIGIVVIPLVGIPKPLMFLLFHEKIDTYFPFVSIAHKQSYSLFNSGIEAHIHLPLSKLWLLMTWRWQELGHQQFVWLSLSAVNEIYYRLLIYNSTMQHGIAHSTTTSMVKLWSHFLPTKDVPLPQGRELFGEKWLQCIGSAVYRNYRFDTKCWFIFTIYHNHMNL